MKTIYVCSDSITGLFSAIYDAWKEKRDETTCGIVFRGHLENELFCDYVEVEETVKKSVAVDHMIRKHLGQEACWHIYHAALSRELQKGDAILGTMIVARRLPNPARIMDHLSHTHVQKVFVLSRSVAGEAHLFKGFVRFRELKNGVLYAKITPKNRVLTCIAPHFADRLPQEDWMIYDAAHQMFVVHEKGKKWVLLEGEGALEEEKLVISESEKEYEKLWQGFCQTIAIESRNNPKCQRQHLPIRFRADMTEFQKA